MPEPQPRLPWPDTIAEFMAAPGLRGVIAGVGSVRRYLGREVERQGIARPMIVCGDRVSASPVAAMIKAALPIKPVVYDGSRPHTPRETIDAGAALARSADIDGLIAIGGSSAVDCAKGIGVLMASGLESMAALEPVDFASFMSRPPVQVASKVPLITASGTLSFAEFTGLFGARHENRKLPYLDQDHVVRTIFLDGEMAAATPAEIWAETGIKALDDALFSWCGHEHAEPFLDPLLTTAIAAIIDLLPGSTSTPDPALRQQVQTAVWITKSHQPRFDRPAYTGWFSTAARHAMGAVLDLPHGAGSCVALLAGLQFHVAATRARQQALAKILGWTVEDTLPSDQSPLADGLIRLMARLGVPTRLGQFPVDPAQLGDVADAMLAESPRLGTRDSILAALRSVA
jgi:alcohol dehydrogenase class IV